jgi:hypothetical protein
MMGDLEGQLELTLGMWAVLLRHCNRQRYTYSQCV